MFSNKIFKKYCSEEWLTVFELKRKVLNFKAKQRIFAVGDEVQGIYFIESGKVKVLGSPEDGVERIIRLASNDNILGHRGIHFKHYHISAEALTDTTLTFLPIDTFLRIVKANPEMAIYLINFMSEELKEAEERMQHSVILDPKRKIALILIKLIDCFGYNKENKNVLDYTLGRSDIANMAGTTYETVIRALAFLAERKYIKLIGKTIAITNEVGLRKLAAGEMKKKPRGRKA